MCDQDRRRFRRQEVAALPHHGAVALAERHHRLARAADAADDRVAIGNRAAAVAGLHHRANQQLVRVELLDEVVRPEHLAGLLVEREHLLLRADREQAIADDERRRVRAGAEAEVLAARRILVLPQRLAGRGVHRDDGFFGVPRPLLGAAVAGAIHRVEPAIVDEDGGVAGAERARPDHRRAGLRPLVREARAVDDEVAVGPAPLPPRISSVMTARCSSTTCGTASATAAAHDPENSHGANYATKPRPRNRSQPRADRDRQAASTSRSCSGVST